MTDVPKPITMTKDKVVLSRSDWNALLDALEDAEDRGAVRASRAREKAGKNDGLPAALYRRIRAGEHPLRIWRLHRKTGLNALAARASVARSYLSEIESGKKPGSAAALHRLARALDISADELFPVSN